MTEEGRERMERRKAAEQAAAHDTQIALELCRKIRDDVNAKDSDRLHAVGLIMKLKERQY